MEHAANVLFSIGPLEVTSTVTTMWAIMAILTLLSWLATRNLQEVPGPLQNAAEISVSFLRKYYTENLGKKHAEKYFPVFATFFVFIIICNYSGILPGAGHLTGFAVPTACLSVTAGLGVIAFFTTHVIGIREKGLGHYLASFCKPLILVVLMLPLNLLEQFIRPASLALGLRPWASRAPSPPARPGCLLCVDAQKSREGPASSPPPHKNALLPSSGPATLPWPFSQSRTKDSPVPMPTPHFFFFLI